MIIKRKNHIDNNKTLFECGIRDGDQLMIVSVVEADNLVIQGRIDTLYFRNAILNSS